MKVLMFLLRTTSPETRGAGPGPGLRSSMTKQGSAMLRVQDAALAAHGASTSRGGDLVASEGDLEAESEQAGQYRRCAQPAFGGVDTKTRSSPRIASGANRYDRDL